MLSKFYLIGDPLDTTGIVELGGASAQVELHGFWLFDIPKSYF